MFINDLRIGTKLGITSGLGILLVTGMLFNQSRSDAAIADAVLSMSEQKQIAFKAVDSQNNMRRAQIGIADIRLQTNVDELDNLAGSVREAIATSEADVEGAVQPAKRVEDRERLEKSRNWAGNITRRLMTWSPRRSNGYRLLPSGFP